MIHKFVLVPDSFKGTINAEEVCSIMAEQIYRHFPSATVISVPVADGGEGTVDCFLSAVGGQKKFVTVKNLYMKSIQAGYGKLNNGSVVIETASCAGLPMVEGKPAPLDVTTYGIGELILQATRQETLSPDTPIILGLGGSATTDGGCGLACALGVKFYDSNGKSFIPTGGSLEQIAHIDISALNADVQRVPIVAMCDIDNPLYGPTGAAYVFSPQKGASPEEVALLDRGLRHLEKMIKQDLKVDVSNIPGGGAAGGIGAGVVAFLNAQLRMGIETVLDTVHFENMIKDADMILTGEGKLDGQSLRGKVIAGVTRRAKKAGVPVVAVVGGIGEGAEEAYKEGLSAMFSINRMPIDFSLARLDAKSNLALAVDNIMRLIQCVKS